MTTLEYVGPGVVLGELLGILDASLRAASERDVAQLVWSTMVVVILGITARFRQMS